MHGFAVHQVASSVADVAASAFPLLHARPKISAGVHVDGVVETQAVLTPHEVGRRVQSEQGAAVGDEGDHRRIREEKRVMDAPMRLDRNVICGHHPAVQKIVVAQVAQVDVPSTVFIGVRGQRQHVLFETVYRLEIARSGHEGLGQGLGFFDRLLEQVWKA